MDRLEKIEIKKAALYDMMIEAWKEVSEQLGDKPVSERTIYQVVLKAKADFFLTLNEQLSDL